MDRRAEFVLLTAMVVLTRVADGATTYLVTPDLGRELNPLASGGWPLLIAVAVAMIGVSTVLNYHQVFRPIDNFSRENDVELKGFKRHYFDPRSNPLAGARPGKVFAYVFGYVLPRTLIVWSALLVLNNALTFAGVEPYLEIKRRYRLWIVFYLALPLIGLGFAERLQRLDYRRYRSRPNWGAGETRPS